MIAIARKRRHPSISLIKPVLFEQPTDNRHEPPERGSVRRGVP